MKKLILFLLIGALLVLPLSGCFADNKQNEETTPNNTTENTTPEGTTPEVTTPEVTTPDPIETAPQIENRAPTPVGDHPFGEGPSTFMAPLFVQPPDLSWGPTLNIRVENGKIYINDYLYESVGILDNPQVSYTEALVWGLEVEKENSEIAETRETAANKLVILETIKNHTSCYVLETQANAKYGTKIAVFYIDGEYYLLNAVDEDVIRIWNVNLE